MSASATRIASGTDRELRVDFGVVNSPRTRLSRTRIRRALGLGQDRVQRAEVIEDRLQREAIARLCRNEGLDVIARYPVKRARPEERHEVHPQA